MATTPTWARVAAFSLSVVGLAVSAYLTYEHLRSGPLLACPDTGVVSCVRVTTSSYSRFLGVPVAALGVAFFVGMTFLCLPALWDRPNPWWGRARLATAGLGVVSVFYLLWAELFGVGAVCLWCSAVHAITVALFGVVAFAQAVATDYT